jgi:hypothetical protein
MAAPERTRQSTGNSASSNCRYSVLCFMSSGNIFDIAAAGRRRARSQASFLPLVIREWLPEDDLVYVIVDAVATVDLRGFRRRYRADGRGRAAFDPAMTVVLLLTLVPRASGPAGLSSRGAYAMWATG